MSTTEQTKQFEALQAWLPPDFDKQDLRNAMGLLLTKVKGLEERLQENKPYDDFNRIDQEIRMLRNLANDANKELAKIPDLENQVKMLVRQGDAQRERILQLEQRAIK